MKKRFSVVEILLAFFVVFASFSASAQETAVGDGALTEPQALSTGSSGLKKAIFLSEKEGAGNANSNDWKSAFNQDVTLGGTSPQCIEMRYSGEVKDETYAPPPFTIQFRATVDGTLAKGGAPYFDAPVPFSFTIAAMNWWVCGLTPGVHNVKVQFRPFYEVDKAVVRSRTLIIEYNQ